MFIHICFFSIYTGAILPHKKSLQFTYQIPDGHGIDEVLSIGFRNPLVFAVIHQDSKDGNEYEDIRGHTDTYEDVHGIGVELADASQALRYTLSILVSGSGGLRWNRKVCR